MKPIRIKVTQEDIDNSRDKYGTPIRLYSKNCPIAQAFMRYFPERPVLVAGMVAQVDGREFYLTEEAYDFQIRADNGLRVEPFEFDAIPQ